MRCWMLWHGGSSYACPRIPEDLERFSSLTRAKEAFWSRQDGDPYYPCVESSSAFIYWRDPTDERDPYPDLELTMGPRGGVRVSPC